MDDEQIDEILDGIEAIMRKWKSSHEELASIRETLEINFGPRDQIPACCNGVQDVVGFEMDGEGLSTQNYLLKILEKLVDRCKSHPRA